MVTGDGWQIEQSSGLYEVTVELDAPLEVRSAAPAVFVDGEEVGSAVESEDGLSLSVVTADPSVLDASAVDAGWSGQPLADTSSAQHQAGGQARTSGPTGPDAATDPTDPTDGATTTAAAAQAVLDADPTAPGEFTVARADYDLGDQAVDLQDIGGQKGEVRAAVYYPQQAAGERPVVVFLHGRHTSCANPTPSTPIPNPGRYPCAEGLVDIPSYLGYDAPAETLASNGYVVVSISANAVNSHDNQLAPDYGATARGGLVLSHLELLAQANAGQAEGLSRELQGRLDLDHVGLMGHSRGGDGVVRAALMNEALPQPFGIESVLPLAPVDFGRLSLPDVPTYTLLPYCDGDVVNLQGQHFYEDSRQAFDDGVLRATGLVMGANHNFFNTNWTPGLYPYAVSDDWAAQDRQQVNPVCGQNAEPRLTPAEQYNLGDAYVSAWFLLTMGAQDEFLPMFDGSGAVPAVVGDAEVHTVAAQAGASQLDVAPLMTASSRVTVQGAATATYCASLDGRPFPQQIPACAQQANVTSSQAPHWTPMRFAPSAPAGQMLDLRWTAADGGVRIAMPSGQRDVSGFENLSFRTAPGQLTSGAQDMTVTVLDGAGRTASFTVSQVSPALTPLPGTATPLRKTYLRTVSYPVAEIAAAGVDLTDVRQIRLGGVGDAGAAYVSDVAFSTPDVGTAGTLALPSLTVGDAYVNEGAGPGEALVGLTLSEPSSVPVTTYVEAIGGSGTVGAQRLASSVTFEPGQTCLAFAVPLEGDRRPSAVPTTSIAVTAATVTNAVTADAFGLLTVREDDAVVLADGTVGQMAPDPGPQTDPCAPRADVVFTDVASTNQFVEEISWLLATGITTGWDTPSGKEFRPLTPVARDAMAAFLFRYSGAPADYVGLETSPFIDVPTTNQFYREISWLYEQGISKGWETPAGLEFRPLASINRDAMAAFLYRFAKEPEVDASAGTMFTDVAPTDQFFTEISWLAQSGISTGYEQPDGSVTFGPLVSVKRDAMAAFLYRYSQLG
ncbi:S-layer homology domain-containing protein [Litorihabitans aurantiacus]|uniref:SLH domain-containing protein n=1 Tax=Litorihabitans aurantiacus TaxID=1930061 RepID=A0AA38CUH6_9MICO|nr:S-layer homology domain-containing protein [Litorihabitans aurantiacus]GMA33401.1 hypothetical protein GCM10025875_33930 [Litorihabitans aurantiacus]